MLTPEEVRAIKERWDEFADEADALADAMDFTMEEETRRAFHTLWKGPGDVAALLKDNAALRARVEELESTLTAQARRDSL